MAVGEYSRATPLLLELLANLPNFDWTERLKRWITSVPGEIIGTDPDLSFIHAEVLSELDLFHAALAV